MSSREKRLLIVLLSALFVVGSLFGYKSIQTKRNAVRVRIAKSEATLALADIALDQADSIKDEVHWLEKNLPDPEEGETKPSELETFVTNEAARVGLSVTRPKILPNDESGVAFHRARFQIAVSGSEASLYRWLTKVQSPKDFRAVTAIRYTPNREDDTQIDATVQVEEWFIPVQDEPLEDPSTAAVEP